MANYTYQFYGPTSYEAIRWRSNSEIQEVFDNWHGGQASHSDHYFDIVVEYEGQETVVCTRHWINDSNEFTCIITVSGTNELESANIFFTIFSCHC